MHKPRRILLAMAVAAAVTLGHNISDGVNATFEFTLNRTRRAASESHGGSMDTTTTETALDERIVASAIGALELYSIHLGRSLGL